MFTISEKNPAGRRAVLAALLLAATLAPAAGRADDHCRPHPIGHGGDDGDDVVLSFATVGDSRQEPGTAGISPQDAIWLQNTQVWSRIMREVRDQGPQMLFFNGDMIMGYADGANAKAHEDMNRQYGFWRGMVTQLLECGTYVVPVPGNHEVQRKYKDAAGKTLKVAQLANEILWRDNMADLVIDVPRFTSLVGVPPGHFDVANNPFAPATAAADHVTTDQKQLSYSFDVGTTHFAVVNTDPVGWDTHAPAAWLRADFQAAKAAGARKFFVFGHKPAFTYAFPTVSGAAVGPNGLDAVADLSGRDAFWATVEDFGATYFCGHEHIYDVSRPGIAQGGKSYQVIVGSGGSPFETDTKPGLDRTYAWAVVDVLANGHARVTTYGFDENQGPTKVLAKFTIH
jgi:hypothetical protein